MILRFTAAAVCFILAIEEFFRLGQASAEVIRRPADLVDALMGGDFSVGPWLLAAYGALLVFQAFEHRRR